MKPVFLIADSIVSPFGWSSAGNFSEITKGHTNVRLHEAGTRSPKAFYSALFTDEFWQQNTIPSFTRFETLLALSIKDALSHTGIRPADRKTGLIISSTKGNISLLEDNAISPSLKKEISLGSSAQKVARHFGFIAKPLIVSHACISGLVALITAKRMLQAGLYENIIVAGADLITRFVLSGFQSFQAVSDEPCRPFDAARKGINLGEAAATMILSTNQPSQNAVELKGGGISNDANHISGPSRTGQELFMAIDQAMKEAKSEPGQIDFVSLHGTATLYNDDMESKAINLAGLQSVPVNSLKGYYGHTLGAAGLVESVISVHALRENVIVPTKGFETPGTAENINVCSTLQYSELKTCLKTASGFGGCNAAVVWEKN
ncbi:beta-ketoacyl synthase N-terminal-like domain-containing protein [Niabella yanshanensis]|uniref:Beta-ketoacyl synthase N-terminal-like domain-containing protein n=1 Tax=Niabella yanshanensis TaxID=577386 RepID=A0ABZ0W0E4_9BACT|nr:beta-ketoacyl synthase N-terminal-like domain-containing protein [Niabella yanshanensis]WQD36728.1 beta-ketoacyl synthase N-terminal-like domain-containing protein [Niabella yanshanensis]